MNDLTLATVGEFLGLIASVMVSCGVIYAKIKKWLGSMFEESMKKFEDRQDKRMDKLESQISDLEKTINISDMESCKNFLVRCLADVERGEPMSETESQRFYEQYEHYIENGGNTYIEHKVEALQKANKI